MRSPLLGLIALAAGAVAQSTLLESSTTFEQEPPFVSSSAVSLIPSSLPAPALSSTPSFPPMVYTTITRGTVIPDPTSSVPFDLNTPTSLPTEYVVTITLASTAGASGWATPSSEAVVTEEARPSAASSSPSNSASARTAAIVLGVLCGIEALVIAYLAYRSRTLADRARRLAAVYPSAPAVTDVRRRPSLEATDVEADARVPHWLSSVEPTTVNSRVPTWLAGVEPGSPPNEKFDRATSPFDRTSLGSPAFGRP